MATWQRDQVALPTENIFFFFYELGTQNGHIVPFLESTSLKKNKRKVLKVVIDLPFEGRKVEGRRKYSRRERVPKAGSRSEETTTELKTANVEQEARVDISARGFWNRGQKAFFDLGVFNPLAPIKSGCSARQE